MPVSDPVETLVMLGALTRYLFHSILLTRHLVADLHDAPMAIRGAKDMSATQDKALVSASETSLKDLAPAVFRQRLLIEGFFTGEMTEDRVRTYLLQLAAFLDLRAYGDPVVFQPTSGMGKEENAGFDAFLPLIDSGISGYFWSGSGFFSILLYTCKGFEVDLAIAHSRELLGVQGEIVAHSF